jgi:hypothetical protein
VLATEQTHVVHLATVKETPDLVMDVTVKGLFQLLEVARESPTVGFHICHQTTCTSKFDQVRAKEIGRLGARTAVQAVHVDWRRCWDGSLLLQGALPFVCAQFATDALNSPCVHSSAPASTQHPTPVTEEQKWSAYPGCYALSKVLEECMLEQYYIQYGLNVCVKFNARPEQLVCRLAVGVRQD